MKKMAVVFLMVILGLSVNMSAQSGYKLQVAGQPGDTLSRAAIVADPVVTVDKLGIPVTSFSLVYKNIDGDLIEIMSGNNLLTAGMLSALTDIRITLIFIDQAKFILNGEEHEVSQKFYLKN